MTNKAISSKTAANLFTAPPRLLKSVLDWTQPLFANPPNKNIQKVFPVDLKGWSYYDRVKDRAKALEAKRYSRELDSYNRDLETHKRVFNESQSHKQDSQDALAPYLKDWSPDNPINLTDAFRRDAKKWGWVGTPVKIPISDGWTLVYPELLRDPSRYHPPILEIPTLIPPRDYLVRNKLDSDTRLYPYELQNVLTPPTPPKDTRTVDGYKITVTLHAVDDNATPNFYGWWYPTKRQVHIYPTRFNWNWDEAQDLINHELVHVGQTILKELLGLKIEAGLPPKRVRSPQYDSGGIPTSHGKPQFPLDPSDPHKRVLHELRDIEFHTRLTDEVRNYNRRFLPAHERGVPGFDYVDWVQGSPFFRSLLKHDYPRYEYAVKTFRNTVVKPQVTPILPKVASPQAAKYKHIDFKPPESVANAAAKGLKLRQRASPSNRGGLTPQEAGKQGIGSGVQRAVNLKNRDNVTPEVISKMVSFFARHEKNKGLSPEHKDAPQNDKGYVAWLLWGGDAGWAWSKKIKSQMESADAK